MIQRKKQKIIHSSTLLTMHNTLQINYVCKYNECYWANRSRENYKHFTLYMLILLWSCVQWRLVEKCLLWLSIKNTYCRIMILTVQSYCYLSNWIFGLHYCLTHMMLSNVIWLTQWPGPPWEVYTCSTGKETSHLLWHTKVHFSIHKTPPLDSSQFNAVHIFTPCLSKIHFNILSICVYICQVLSSIKVSQLKFCMYFSSPHTHYMPCPSHLPWCKWVLNYIWLWVHNMKLLIT
jgi:hypothetical protein